MPISDAFRPRIAAKLRRLYGSRAKSVLGRLDELADRYASLAEGRDKRLYGPQTMMLITYPDQLRSKGRPSLQVLNGFLHEYGLDKVISGKPVSRDGYEVESYDIAWLA